MDKLLFFLPKISFGGAERIMISLSNEFAKKGYNVIVVINEKRRDDIYFINDKVKIYEILSNQPLIVVYNLVRLINIEKPDIAISALDNGNLYLLSASIFTNTNTKYHTSIHCNLSQVQITEKGFKGRMARFILSFLYSRSKSIIAVSKGVQEDFLKNVQNPKLVTKVLYNPVVSEELQFKANVKIEKDNFNIGSYKIISVGRFVEQKNFKLLIESFAILKSKLPCSLTLVGDGPLLEDLNQLVSDLSLNDAVVLTGFVTNPYNLMKNADLFVLSSIYEGLPTVLIEAMACGTKVVSTDCPSGPREILEDGLWGKLVPLDNKYALADAMFDSLMEKDTPDVQKRANEFSVELAAQKYLEHFGLA